MTTKFVGDPSMIRRTMGRIAAVIRIRTTRSSDPAGAVSNQNGEEAESGLRADGTHPEPRTDDQPDEPERSSP
jgi:hypothetical protein